MQAWPITLSIPIFAVEEPLMSSTDEIKNIVETVGRNTDELWRKYRQRLSENVSRVWLLGEAESRELKHVFVELSIEEYRRPSDRNQWMGFVDAELRKRRSLFWDSLDFSEEKEKKTIQSDNLLRDGTRAVITGAPGCGKSTLLRWLVGKALNDASPCLPVFLELKSVNEELFKACQGKLIELLFELAIAQPLHFERQSECEYLKAEFMERLAQRQVAIFLDGLDEVRNTVFFEELCRSIDSFIGSDYGRNLLIVSTRPYALDVLFQDTKEMEIQPLNQDQIAAFLHHYYDGDPRLNVNALVQKLQRRELSDMIRAPILLGALVKRYREKGETELTGDRLKLYEDLTHDLAVTVDREKNVKRYSFSDKESRRNLEFLEQIAFKRLFDERIESDAQRLTFEGDWILNEAKGFCSQGNIDAYDFAADVKATPLLREVAEDVWAFSHLTIQEYLAARALTVRSDGEVVFCRAYFNPTLVEMEALPMALGLSKEPDKLYRVIEQLPESLNFAGLRLRARGLAFGAGISHSLFEQLVDRLIEFAGNAYIEETGYSYSIVRSYMGAGNMRSDFIGERVRQLLKSEDGQVRSSAAEALGKIGREQAVAGLIEALKDLDDLVRSSAAKALELIKIESLTKGLQVAMSHQNGFVRRKAAKVIGYYSVVVAEKELNRLAESDPDLEVKQVAENALTQLELKKRYFGHSADGDS
jgi:energy-coupling factor transporter ATP-binding protein EcfA2